MTKHQYSSIALLCIITFILGAFAIAELDTNDLDSVCSTNNATLKRINGSWQCSITHYGEGYFHSYNNPATIEIPITNTYYIITNYTIDSTYGFEYNSSGLIIQKEAQYRLNLQMSMQGGNGGDYEVELHRNGLPCEDCAVFTTTSMGNHYQMVISCIEEANIGDILDVRVKDLNNPSQDISYHQLNFNIMEII